ncbi:PGF-pre-PGF domain-containing protein [Candidatus Woesearchaeota archaeon]|nr:PGF-pre-PGF domain-containing protein [Candidatus Woesearchaeota archaeon]
MRKTDLLVMLLIIVSTIPFVVSQSSDFNVSLSLIPTATCSDGIQNQGETGVDCGGPCAACQTSSSPGGSSSSGGSSGGAYNPNWNATPSYFSKKFFMIKANETIANDIEITNLSVYWFDLTTKNDVKNVTIDIRSYDENLPIYEQTISPYNYQYFKISASNVQLEDLSSIRIKFKISKEWIDNQSASFEGFSILNYGTEWTETESEFIDEDAEYYYFFATPSKLGFFSIIGKEAESTTEEIKAKESPFEKLKDTLEMEDGKMFSPSLGNILKLTGIIIVLAVVSSLTFFGISLFLKRKGGIFDSRVTKMKDKIQTYEERIKEIDDRIKNL